MKNSFSATLRAHLSGTVTTVATLWKVTLTNGTVYGFTDHQTDIVYGGITYQAATGFSPSAIAANSDLSVDNLSLAGFLSSPTITEEDLRAGLWDFATVEVMLVNYADLTMGAGILRKGTLGQVKTGRIAFEAEMRGLSQQLQQQIVRLIAPSCDALLGDARCAVNLAPLTVTGTITSVTDARQFADSSRTEADDYFDYGVITWTSGANAGLTGEVKTYTQAGGVIALNLAMPYVVQVGDTYSMVPGCDKVVTTCISKFNNAVNFRGFPDVPGLDWQASGVQ